jgi:hypothetical protein
MVHFRTDLGRLLQISCGFVITNGYNRLTLDARIDFRNGYWN